MMPRDTFLLLVYVFIVPASFALVFLAILDDSNTDEHKVLRAIYMTIVAIVAIVLLLRAGFSMEKVIK